MYVKTHVMMLHSEFCAVCSSLSDVSTMKQSIQAASIVSVETVIAVF